MGLPKLKTEISIEYYLEGEKISPTRHEYVEGEVYSTADASDNHSRIVINLTTNFSVHLCNSKYKTFSNDIKVQITKNVYYFNVFYYPDVLVSCEENPEDVHFRNFPVLIIEVTSPSTKHIDRREKLLFYQQMPSVQEYAIIDQHKINIEIHRRQPNGSWITYYFDKEDTEIEFQSIELTLPLSEIYRRVNFQTNANSDDE
jgi:Uma2 family endonuclease